VYAEECGGVTFHTTPPPSQPAIAFSGGRSFASIGNNEQLSAAQQFIMTLVCTRSAMHAEQPTAWTVAVKTSTTDAVKVFTDHLHLLARERALRGMTLSPACERKARLRVLSSLMRFAEPRDAHAGPQWPHVFHVFRPASPTSSLGELSATLSLEYAVQEARAAADVATRTVSILVMKAAAGVLGTGARTSGTAGCDTTVTLVSRDDGTAVGPGDADASAAYLKLTVASARQLLPVAELRFATV
jgi:hypothetical protein